MVAGQTVGTAELPTGDLKVHQIGIPKKPAP